MSHTFYDEIEWETIVHHHPCTSCNGDSSKCRGGYNGSFGIRTQRRAQSEIDRLKAERQRKADDAILAQAEVIRARRGEQT